MPDHGDQYRALREALQSLATTLPRTPRALVVVSAHWEEPEFSVSSAARPSMIYDYGGFPPETYEISYPAPGDAELARRIVELGASNGIAVSADAERGFDHGVFVPLAVSFPDADIPVVSVSLRQGLDPAEHLAFGAALEPLRDDNVAIIGSGLSTHDLRFAVTASQAEDFHEWLNDTMALDVHARADALLGWSAAPGGRACHPREEHLLPLMVAAGAGGDDPVRPFAAVELFGLPATGFVFGGA